MAGLTRRLTPRLVERLPHALTGRARTRSVVLDADDTTLWTYDMEDAAMHFNFDPILQDDQWVQPQKFPATPGMVALTKAVDAAGCTLVGLTGRNDGQKDATLGNLAKVGYTGFTDGRTTTPSGTAGPSRTTGPWLAGHPVRGRRLHDHRVQVADPQARRRDRVTASWPTSATSSAT